MSEKKIKESGIDEIEVKSGNPIVFISHNRVKEGKLNDYIQFFSEGSKDIQASKPKTVVFLAFLNEQGTEVTIVHVFPDAEAMNLHMQGAGDRAKKAYEFIESDRFEVYGTPNAEVLEMLKKVAGSGVRLTFAPQNLGGFIRSGMIC